jgi:hypothetical protein
MYNATEEVEHKQVDFSKDPVPTIACFLLEIRALRGAV